MAIPKYYVRPDGLHETIIKINGKRKAFRGRTDREVWEKVKSYRADAAAGKTETFENVAHAWWNEIEPTLADNSYKNYKPAYNRAIAEFGKADVSSITAKDVEKYINCFAKTYAKKTVTTQRQIIRQILNKAQREGYIAYNPADAVLLPKNLPQKKRRAPSPAQIKLIKKSLDKTFGLFAYLIYYTGCRRGEALALRYEDIDRKAKKVRINKSAYYIGARPYIKSPKTEAGDRVVPLLSALASALPNKKHGYIFSDDGGETPLMNHRVTKLYASYQAETGVTVTPHEIRHGYATALHDAGVDYKTAQTLLGHAQLSTTMDIYTDVLDNTIDEAAAKMDRNF